MKKLIATGFMVSIIGCTHISSNERNQNLNAYEQASNALLETVRESESFAVSNEWNRISLKNDSSERYEPYLKACIDELYTKSRSGKTTQTQAIPELIYCMEGKGWKLEPVVIILNR